MDICALVLSAGKGRRMNTDIAKCAYPFLGKPIITYIIDTLKNMNIDICVVVGYKKEQIMDILKDSVSYAYQPIINGTAGAVKAAKTYWKNKNGIILIMLGDMPLIDQEIIKKLITTHLNEHNDLTIATTILDNPTGYGRIIKNNKIIIREEKDASKSEKLIKEVNSGLFVINKEALDMAIDKIENNNNQKEYYITDIVSILSENKKVSTCLFKESKKLMGINNIETLKKLEEII